MKVQMIPYRIETASNPIPDIVSEFIDKGFPKECDDYKVTILEKRDIPHHEDASRGVSYMNRLVVRKGEKIVYDTGMVTYRDGRPGYPTNHRLCYRRAGIIALNGYVFLGTESGDDVIDVRYLCRSRHYLSYDIGQAKRNAENGSIDPTKLPNLRAHFKNTQNRGEQYPWAIGSGDIVCDLGTGFMAFHNGQSGRGGEVWNKCVVVLVHDGKPYISNPIPIPLSGDNWCITHLMSRSIKGNSFKCGFVCCRYDAWKYNWTPTIVEFELEMGA